MSNGVPRLVDAHGQLLLHFLIGCTPTHGCLSIQSFRLAAHLHIDHMDVRGHRSFRSLPSTHSHPPTPLLFFPLQATVTVTLQLRDGSTFISCAIVEIHNTQKGLVTHNAFAGTETSLSRVSSQTCTFTDHDRVYQSNYHSFN